MIKLTLTVYKRNVFIKYYYFGCMENYSNKFHDIRQKYQQKRLTKAWKKRKKNNKRLRLFGISQERFYSEKSYIDYEAPSRFSFINNTNAVLLYFNDISDFISKKQSVNVDISEIKELSPDVITLMMAKLSEKRSKKVGLKGNAPKNPVLKKMFVESGLYNFVTSFGRKTVSLNNKLWKHSTNSTVKGEIAAQAAKACKEMFLANGINYDTDSLYNLLVEAMSNTLNHANNNNPNVNWWLYYYHDQASNTLKYSFIDLGIGIFKSASFDSYKEVIKHVYQGNKILVKPFLEGKIISSRKTDHAISGKGVRQIINCAKLPEFKAFLIITNDLKINIKTQQSEELNSNFAGTFIYFEISCN